MKKYLFTSAAALAFCGLFTSCTHDLGYDESSAQNSVVKTYEQAFVTAFGQPDPNQEWGFGSSTVASTRAMTRDITGFTKLGEDDFSKKSNISQPDPIGKPSINKDNATIIVSDKTTTWTNQNTDNAVVYVESGVTLNLPDWSSLQNTKFYLSSGSTLNAQNLYLKGTTEFVNDGGTINIGSANSQADFKMENFTGTFWNNGTVNVSKEFTPYTDGGKIYNGSNGTITATKIYLFKNVELWNEGTITLSDSFYADQYGHKIYNSGTITTPSLTLEKEITLWNEGTFNANNLTCRNDDIDIYNGSNATLSMASIDFNNNRQRMVNDGTVTVSGDIQLRNTDAEIVNKGTLTGASLSLKAGVKYYTGENAVTKITGTTLIDNSNSMWVNDGKYTSGDFVLQASAYKVWNNCKLTVTSTGTTGEGIFHLNRATFFLDGGGSVITDYFYWEDTSNFYMGGKALVDVKIELNTRNYNSDYGFRGMGDANSYSVLRAKKITKHADVQFSLSCFGYLYVDCDDMFKQGYIDTSHVQAYYYFADTVKYGKEEDAPVSIDGSEDGCNPGYNKKKDPEPSSGKLRIICEDLSAKASDGENSDWDFNDVVFDIQLVDNDTKVKITLKAAGGTLPLCVGDLDHEVHGLFAEANPGKGITTSTMINTRSTGAKYTLRDCNEAVFYLDIDDTWKAGANLSEDDGLLKAVAKNMPVQVYKMVSGTKTWVTMEAKKGDPAAKMAVGTDYDWCDERTDIRDQYRADIQNSPDKFSTFKLYVKNILGDGWYNVTEVSQSQVNAYNQ